LERDLERNLKKDLVRFVQPSAAKLNLSLRVTKKREDGYHDIVSVFVRLPSVETLLISKAQGAGGNTVGDTVRAQGVDVGVEKENIVSRGLRCLRDMGYDVPFLDVEILKTLYPGSGLGGGSGNGAAILRWFAGGRKGLRDDVRWRDAALKTGADVPFLFSGIPWALVSGIGDVVEPLEPLKSRLHASIVFPNWSVGTENAYGQLDRRYGGAYPGVYPMDEPAARTEASNLCRKLRNEEHLGLLPNDFAPGLMDKFPDYGKLFDIFEKNGGCAWGITGSGGAAFGLFYEALNLVTFDWPSWVRQVLSVELP
jgi:4-diphosphocytidyl-2-C-methyl-D-erythritol kinase